MLLSLNEKPAAKLSFLSNQSGCAFDKVGLKTKFIITTFCPWVFWKSDLDFWCMSQFSIKMLERNTGLNFMDILECKSCTLYKTSSCVSLSVNCVIVSTTITQSKEYCNWGMSQNPERFRVDVTIHSENDQHARHNSNSKKKRQDKVHISWSSLFIFIYCRETRNSL